MTEAPLTIKQRLRKACESMKVENASQLDKEFVYWLVESAIDDLTIHYMNGALCFDEKGNFTPNKIIALIQRQAEPFGNVIPQSKTEIAQKVAKLLREQGGAQQLGRADIFKTPTAAQSMAEAEKARQTHGQLFKFGIDGLDFFGGVYGGQMLSIFGNPSSWKTALLTNGIRNWLSNGGGKVMLFELDMGRGAMFDRLISSRLQVPFWRLNELQETAEYEKAKKEIIAFCDGEAWDNKDAHFRIIDKFNGAGEEWTLEMVIEAIERDAPAVVCIDYLTLLKSETAKNKPISDYEIANKAIDALYDTAKRYGIIVITLSQMSMESRRIQAQGGSGGTAKGGGKVEERSDAVIELFRDTGTDEAGKTTSDIIATIKKARNNEPSTGNSYRLTHTYGRFNSTAEQVQQKKKPPQKLFDTVDISWAGY